MKEISSNAHDKFDDEAMPDAWEPFRGREGDPIGIEQLKRLALADMPEDISISVLGNYFPETRLSRDGDSIVCEIQEHLYTKYREHKFSAYAFADAMLFAVRRLSQEGHPFSKSSLDNDDDIHIFVRWELRMPRTSPLEVVVDSIKAAFDLVWQRADAMLENSDSVLILGKDTGPGLERLKRIETKLQELGYYTRCHRGAREHCRLCGGARGRRRD